MIGTKFAKPLQANTVVRYEGAKRIEENNTAPNTYAKYAEAAAWCNANNAMIEDKGDYYEVVAVPAPTTEELAKAEMQRLKRERAEAVSKLIVEVDGLKFDADEESQSRMSRTITAALSLNVDLAKEKRTWVLADNTIAEVSIKQLSEALRLAGDAQTKLWTVPYETASTNTLSLAKVGI